MRTKAMRNAWLAACLLAGLILSAGPASAALGAASPQVLSSTHRIDFGALAPGDSREGRFVLSNPGFVAVEAVFVQEGAGPLFASLNASSLLLYPGESREVRFTYRVPADAPPGNHGEAIKYVVRPLVDAPEAAGDGHLSAGTAILLTSRTLGIGLLSLEAPEVILPGDNLTVTARLVNTWTANASVSVNLSLLAKGTNATFLENRSEAALVVPDGSARLAFAWPNLTLPRGEYFLSARLDNLTPQDAPVAASTFRVPLLVGAREARLALASVEDRRDGNATATLNVTNTGTVPITVYPRLTFTPLGGVGEAYEVTLDPITLAPGESRLVSATVALPPGRFTLAADDRNADTGRLTLHSVESTSAVFTMAPPAATVSGGAWLRALLPFWWAPLLVLGMAAAAGGAVLVAQRRRARRPATTSAAGGIAWARFRVGLRDRWRHRKAASKRRVQPASGLDAFLLALEAQERPTPLTADSHLTGTPPTEQARVTTVALFVDVRSLYGDADAPRTSASLDDLYAMVGHRPEGVRAFAYLCASTPSEASLAREALARAGFEPVVRVARDASDLNAPDLYVQAALDVARALQEGRAIVVATHDERFAPIARFVRESGAHLAVAGVPGLLPEALRDHAEAIHGLPRDP